MDPGLTQLIRRPFVKLGQIKDPGAVRQDRSWSHLLLDEGCRSGRTFPSRKPAWLKKDGEKPISTRTMP